MISYLSGEAIPLMISLLWQVKCSGMHAIDTPADDRVLPALISEYQLVTLFATLWKINKYATEFPIGVDFIILTWLACGFRSPDCVKWIFKDRGFEILTNGNGILEDCSFDFWRFDSGVDMEITYNKSWMKWTYILSGRFWLKNTPIPLSIPVDFIWGRIHQNQLSRYEVSALLYTNFSFFFSSNNLCMTILRHLRCYRVLELSWLPELRTPLAWFIGCVGLITEL